MKLFLKVDLVTGQVTQRLRKELSETQKHDRKKSEKLFLEFERFPRPRVRKLMSCQSGQVDRNLLEHYACCQIYKKLIRYEIKKT